MCVVRRQRSIWSDSFAYFKRLHNFAHTQTSIQWQNVRQIEFADLFIIRRWVVVLLLCRIAALPHLTTDGRRQKLRRILITMYDEWIHLCSPIFISSIWFMSAIRLCDRVASNCSTIVLRAKQQWHQRRAWVNKCTVKSIKSHNTSSGACLVLLMCQLNVK